MLTYTVELVREGSPSVQTTLHLEGAAAATDWEKINRASFDALNSCDHLVVNIEKIQQLNCTLLLLICVIRRTAQLLGKEVTIEGNVPGSSICAYEYALRSEEKPCTLALSSPCYLWESLAGPVPHPLLEPGQNNRTSSVMEKS